MLLVNEQGEMWSKSPDALDAYVFQPRTRLAHGRSHWMSMGGLRAPETLSMAEAAEPMLFQALVIGESEDAVPLDQVIWWPGSPRPALMLRRGSYVIRVIDRHGRELHRETLHVE